MTESSRARHPERALLALAGAAALAVLRQKSTRREQGPAVALALGLAAAAFVGAKTLPGLARVVSFEMRVSRWRRRLEQALRARRFADVALIVVDLLERASPQVARRVLLDPLHDCCPLTGRVSRDAALAGCLALAAEEAADETAAARDACASGVAPETVALVGHNEEPGRAGGPAGALACVLSAVGRRDPELLRTMCGQAGTEDGGRGGAAAVARSQARTLALVLGDGRDGAGGGAGDGSPPLELADEGAAGNRAQARLERLADTMSNPNGPHPRDVTAAAAWLTRASIGDTADARPGAVVASDGEGGDCSMSSLSSLCLTSSVHLFLSLQHSTSRYSPQESGGSTSQRRATTRSLERRWCARRRQLAVLLMTRRSMAVSEQSSWRPSTFTSALFAPSSSPARPRTLSTTRACQCSTSQRSRRQVTPPMGAAPLPSQPSLSSALALTPRGSAS